MKLESESIKFANLETHTIEQRKRLAELEALAARKDREAVIEQAVSFVAGVVLAAVVCLAVWNWGK